MRPEIKFILSCLMVKTDEQNISRIVHLLDEDLDWIFLVETAICHQVVPLMHQRLMSIPDANVPEDIMSALQTFCDRRKDQNQALLNELISILSTLKTQGINVIPFKGPSLGMQAYNDIGMRVFSDLDFLIPEEHYRKVLELLREMDYQSEAWKTANTTFASWRYYGQDILCHKRTKTVIEPHWLFAPRHFSIKLDFEQLWNRTSEENINGEVVNVLSPEDHLLITCVHGCKEQWIFLRQVCDVAGLIENNKKLNWEKLLHTAKDNNCLRMLLIGLGLANRMLSVELPVAVLELIQNDQTTVSLIDEVFEQLINERQKISGFVKINYFRLQMRDHWQEKLKYVLGTWFMPSDRHFQMVKFPPIFFWLYIPVKCIHDYLLLPVWNSTKKITRPA